MKTMTAPSLYGAIADLPLEISGYDVEFLGFILLDR
jgi:hypothetical protein